MSLKFRMGESDSNWIIVRISMRENVKTEEKNNINSNKRI